MKILIAYDGSSCADSALEDMRRAGLPRVAEAAVLSVSELWMPVLESAGAGEVRIVGAFSFPCASSAACNLTTPSVKAPVLSEQSAFMLPKFSIEASCLTITRRRAIRSAPIAKLTLTIAGSSSGISLR
jgi:hypothetical protein